MKNYQAVIIIIAVTVAVFANSLGNGFVYDDKHFITKNDSIRNLGNIPSFFTSLKSFSTKGEFYIYRPLSTITYALDYSLFKLNPCGYHVSSVLWHIINGVMLYFLMALILRNRVMSLLVAVLFAVHPIQIETVSWVSQRSNLICGFFFLLTLFLWIKMSAGGRETLNRKKYLFAGSLISYAVALFGKEMAIMVPVMLILYDFFFLDGKNRLRRRVKLYAPFFVVSILYVLLRGSVLGRLSGQNEFAGGSVYTAVLTMFKAIAYYAWLLLAPVKICAEPVFTPAAGLFDIRVLGSLALTGAMVVCGIRLFRKSRTISFFVFWFFITLIPVSNLIPLQDVLVAERFMYIPSIGFYAVLALLAGKLYGSEVKWIGKSTAVFTGLLILAYCYVSVNRNVDWRNDFNLCSSTLECNPGSYRSINGLGLEYLRRGEYEKAIEKFEKVIELRPGYAIAHNNLAMAYEKSGFLEKAREIYERIKNTRYYADEIRFNAAEAEHKRGMYEEAIKGYKGVLKVNPGHSKTHNNLGCIYLGLGREEEAVREFERSVQTDPDYFEGYFNLGAVAVSKGNYEKALRQFNRVLEIKPDYARARVSIGELYSAKGMTGRAIAAYKKAIEMDPELVDAYNNLGVVYNNTSRFDEALKVYRKAIEIDPGFATAHNGLGVAFWGKGMKKEAIKEIKRALEINPDLPEAKNNYEQIRQFE